AEEEPAGDEEKQVLHVTAEYREFDYKRKIAIAVGDVRFVPPRTDRLIEADAGVFWLEEKEAYLEGNVRIFKTLGEPVEPGAFRVPRPEPGDRRGLLPNESIEKAGDLDDIIETRIEAKTVLVDRSAPISECKRVYVNWREGDEAAYLVKPVLRFAKAEKVAAWVVKAPSAEGIATYRIPVVDEHGKPTGEYETRRHYVLDNPTFTVCRFKEPHTLLRGSSGEMVEDGFVAMRNVVAEAYGQPVFYAPYLYKDMEHDWPWIKLTAGTSSRMGVFLGIITRLDLARGVELRPRVELMSERGVGLGLGGEYRFAHEDAIRGALDAFWIPNDSGTDEFADTSRPGSGWTPGNWPPAKGPFPADIPLGIDSRYRIKFTHQQEYPEHWEFDLEVHKFSDAGIYREYFEEEFKTEKPPETRAMLKYRKDNWAFFIHVKKQINDFLTQTEYLPQVGLNIVAQPIGAGMLWTSDTEIARVTTRFSDLRRRQGQTLPNITRKWLHYNEYTRPAGLSLREQDTERLTGWRIDTVNLVSRPFEVGIFDVEPYVGWRVSWFEHGLESIRGAYGGVLPPVGPALPGPVGAARTYTGSRVRNQVLAGGRVATQFHRTVDVSDRPLLRSLFPHGQRHIITPEMTYTWESDPDVDPRRLPTNDSVTEEGGLHRINVALRNRWQTRRAPKIERDPRAPIGGEWHRRKLAYLRARESEPVDVVDLDMDIDLFLQPARDNVHPRGHRTRHLSNLRTDFLFRPSKRTRLFLDNEFALEGGQFEVIRAGFARQVRPGLELSLSHDYHFHEASLLGLAADWEINPKWHVRFDVQQDLSGGGDWDRTIELSRRFHEWQLTVGYEYDKGKGASLGTVHVGPTLTRGYYPSWRYQPRSIREFQLTETTR
ncbi:MAG: LPS assembly protein LptD, partial [Planctomycetota bacterium]